MPGLRRNNRLELTPLEIRTNPGVVTSINDQPYSESNPETWKPGQLRYEINKAMELGGSPVTFNTNPAFGVDFDDPAGKGDIHLLVIKMDVLFTPFLPAKKTRFPEHFFFI